MSCKWRRLWGKSPYGLTPAGGVLAFGEQVVREALEEKKVLQREVAAREHLLLDA